MTDPDAFVETVREENRTPLSRLGSSKSLYAATGGDVETDAVLAATADAEHAAWRTFAAWADDESHPAAREAFAATAEAERGHYETVTEHLGEDGHEPEAIPALHEHLRGLESTVERVGGFVGRILASRRSKEQVVGYFVGDADPETAAVFREFGADLDDQLDDARALLADVCESEADRRAAADAAADAIETAYEEYVENLEELGANPKPVC